MVSRRVLDELQVGLFDKRPDRRRPSLACSACPVRHDMPQRIAMTRRMRVRRPRLWLTPEIEYASYASWMVARLKENEYLRKQDPAFIEQLRKGPVGAVIERVCAPPSAGVLPPLPLARGRLGPGKT